MMEPDQIRNVIEACLLVAGRPMSVAQLESLFGEDEDRPDRAAIREALAALASGYDGRGIELVEVGGGWRLQTRATMEHWVARLFAERPPRYSRALLETLVLIAYRQPITRGEIEEVRGVAVSSNIVRTLQDRQWVREVGHKDVPGKPALLGTTSEFLDYFNLRRLDDLPALGEISDLDGIEAVLAAELGIVEEGGEAANDGDGPSAAPAEAVQASAASDGSPTETAKDDVGAGTETDRDIEGDAVVGTDAFRSDDSSDVVEPVGAEDGREPSDANGGDPEADTSSTDDTNTEAEVGDDAATIGSSVTPDAAVEPLLDDGASASIPRDGSPRERTEERADASSASRVTGDVGAVTVGESDDAPSTAAPPHADGPAAERVRGTTASAADAGVAEVLEAEPPVVAIVRPADADGAEARLFRAIGEFAEEHRVEIEARDAFERRSAATRAVHDTEARAANDGDRSTERAGDPEDDRAGGREDDREGAFGGHPGGRPDVSRSSEGEASDGTHDVEDGAPSADPPDPSDADP